MNAANSLEPWNFRTVTPEESDALYQLWKSLVGTPYCAWDDNYPARADAVNDTADGVAFCLDRLGEPLFPAVGTLRHCAEHDTVAPWRSRRPCDLMRIGVRREWQGHGLGALLLNRLIRQAGALGFDGMRILVCADNLPALRLYEKIGSEVRGETDAYNIHWICREILFGFVLNDD